MSRTKKFKMTDLGPIPEDWEIKSISETCCDYAYGVGAEAVAFDGENKYLRITDIDDESHAFVPSPLASPSFFDKCHIAKEGDLFVARTGASVGKSYLYKREDGKLVFAGFLMKAHVKDACPQFVSYITQTASYKCWVESESARSGQPGLNLQQFKTCQFAVAPLPEQRRIAAALSDADELIAALTELLEKKRNLKQGVMQQLLTGKRRLPGFKGKWVEKEIGSLCKICNGRDYKHLSPDDVPVYGTGGEMARVSDWLYDGETVCIGRKGTIDQPQYHTGKIWTVDTLFYTTRFVGVLPKWLFYKFLLVDWNSYNAASGVPSLTSKNIEQIELRVPSDIEEQQAIAEVLTDIDEEIAGIETELEKAKNMKTGMMQQLLTGKVRLEVA